MASLHSIFQDIADIISNDSDRESLKLKLENDAFDWEKIVPVASSHLIIPLIYCKLKEKEVLHLLPEDLKSYLEEITRQNRERNNTILDEVQEISILFNKNKVDHVFLKGAAMLASGIYKDIAERMVGDIDILVHPDQLSKAQNLLIIHGYFEVETTFGFNFFVNKHLARLIPDKKLAAVEIHRKLVQGIGILDLEPIKILSQKQEVNSVLIPSYKDLLVHAVLNFEVNDHGHYYNYLGLRNTYDSILLMERISKAYILNLQSKKHIRSFFEKAEVYFSVFEINSGRGVFQYRKKIFVLKQKSKLMSVASYKLLNIFQFGALISDRLFLYIKNPTYRKAVLKDRKRILKLITGKIESF